MAAGFTDIATWSRADVLRALSTEKTLEFTPRDADRLPPLEYVPPQPHRRARLGQAVPDRRSGAPARTALHVISFFRTDATKTVANGVSMYALDSGQRHVRAVALALADARQRQPRDERSRRRPLGPDRSRLAAFGDAQLRAARLAPVQVAISNGYYGVPGMVIDTSGPNQMLFMEADAGLVRRADDRPHAPGGGSHCLTVFLPELRPPPLTQAVLDAWFQGP